MNAPNRLFLIAALSLASQAALAQPQDLWAAIQRSELAVIEAYLEEDGDPNVGARAPATILEDGRRIEHEPWPLLRIAVIGREEDIALTLLRAGADFEVTGESLGRVASQGMAETLRYLIQQNPSRLRDASPLDQAGVLQSAAEKGYFQVAEVALSEAQRMGLQWDDGWFAESAALAIADRQADIARLYYEAGAPLKPTTAFTAARDSSPGILRYVLSLGADPNVVRPEQSVTGLGLRTPMDVAWFRYDHTEGAEREQARLVLHELLRAGAQPINGRPEDVPLDGSALLAEIADTGERLVEAARLGFYEIVDEAIRNQWADPGAMREATAAALHMRHNDIAFLLIHAGAPLDGGPLHAATRGNSPGLVREMLARGADPNELVDGLTAIGHWWERNQRMDWGAAGDFVLHELIRGGADVCWLVDHMQQLNIFAAGFLRDTASHCWPDPLRD